MFRIGCVNPYTSTANKSSSFFKKLKRNLKFCYKAIIFGSQTYLYLHIFISSGFCLTLSSRSLPLLPKYVCFYSLLNSSQSDVVFWMFIAVHTFVSEASFSKSIWLVVALCTLFFLGRALNNHRGSCLKWIGYQVPLWYILRLWKFLFLVISYSKSIKSI